MLDSGRIMQCIVCFWDLFTGWSSNLNLWDKAGRQWQKVILIMNFESRKHNYELQRAERADYIKCGSDALKWGLCCGVVVSLAALKQKCAWWKSLRIFVQFSCLIFVFYFEIIGHGFYFEGLFFSGWFFSAPHDYIHMWLVT